MVHIKSISIIFLLVFLSNCKSKEAHNESLTTSKTPFTISEATYRYWYGGREGVRGISIKITGSNPKKNLVFKKLYYKKQESKIYTEIKDNTLFLSANVSTSNGKIIPQRAHVEPQQKQEEPVKLKYPNLKEGEAILSYTQNNTEKVTKVILTKKEDLYYP